MAVANNVGKSIIVAGGLGNDSVEMFDMRQRTWLSLPAMPQPRGGGTSFVYDNYLSIAGGYCRNFGKVDNVIQMNVDQSPDIATHWSNSPIRLPTQLAYHSSVLYNDSLIVTGGYDHQNSTSSSIHQVQLAPPYTVTALSRMPEERRFHCMEIFDDNLFIVGGFTPRFNRTSLASILHYDIKKNECKRLSAGLPYMVSDMASVRWGDNIIVVGGFDTYRRNSCMDSVGLYNVKIEQRSILPAMKYKRRACAAVVIENYIIVLGGVDEEGHYLKSVEAFNLERNTWEELPDMSKGRIKHVAVVV
ncbi:kelch-like protein 4 [Dendronephthya gigantea]|uniref:kelch-like protein 4 n=1 Tax=Dendronephthya gigantea TaxID=151771 RepID=UPI00106AE68B|nr:kelch-like protein 4 [Dendronephthya gigantea]